MLNRLSNDQYYMLLLCNKIFFTALKILLLENKSYFQNLKSENECLMVSPEGIIQDHATVQDLPLLLKVHELKRMSDWGDFQIFFTMLYVFFLHCILGFFFNQFT